jgi:hypothetical protein
MGTSTTDAAGSGEQELEGLVESSATACVGCGRPLASVLEQLGSLRCHDCRDGEATDPVGGAPSGR